jgi:hypothetical protein
MPSIYVFTHGGQLSLHPDTWPAPDQFGLLPNGRALCTISPLAAALLSEQVFLSVMGYAVLWLAK